MSTLTMNELVAARNEHISEWQSNAIAIVQDLKSELNVGRKQYTGGIRFDDSTDYSQNELGIASVFTQNGLVVSMRRELEMHRAPSDETRITFEFPKDSDPRQDPIKVSAYKGNNLRDTTTIAQSATREELRGKVAQYVADLEL